MRTCEHGCNGCDDCTDNEPRKAMMTDKSGPSDLYRSLTEPDGWRDRDKAIDAAFIDAIPRLSGDPQEPGGDDGGYLPPPPVGHPLHTLGVRLASLLDEDQWAECERMLSEGWKDAKAKAALWSAAKNKAETNDLLALQESDELRASLAAVLRHWREFGPEHGFDECIERAAAWALGPNAKAERPETAEPLK